jgi:DNA-directed RNA polymerase subunit RPC12/RpoP
MEVEMFNMPTIYGDEIYRCYKCNKDFEYFDVRKDWKCPECGIPISIRAEIGKDILCINRIPPCNLKVDNLYRLGKDDRYLVLECHEQENGFYIALKNYRSFILPLDDFVSIIVGSWK